MPTANARFALLALLLAAITAMGGCSATTPLDAATVSDLAALSYPEDAPTADDPDIVVVRSGKQVRLANRTSESFEQVQLWLNRQYVAQIDDLAIGTGNVVPLNRAINQYEEMYPVGAALAPDKNLKLVSAELYNPRTNTRYRLTVQPELPGFRIPLINLITGYEDE